MELAFVIIGAVCAAVSVVNAYVARRSTGRGRPGGRSGERGEATDDLGQR